MLRNIRAYKQVMHDLKLPRSKLDYLIRKRLGTVLKSAFRHVPYYREMMRKIDYNPFGNYNGPEDLLLFPVTTKQILKNKGTAAFTNARIDLSKCYAESTSGATGIPLTIYRTPYEKSVATANWLRILFLNGYSLRQKVMVISSMKNPDESKTILQHFGLLRRLHVNYLLSIEKIADRLLEYEPDILYALGSLLELLAHELRHRGIKPKGLKFIVSCGEIVYERTRQLCRDCLGAELIESYGSEEMGFMAYETPNRDGLHLCEDLTYFEFLNDDGSPVAPGEPGKVVVTHLMAKLMPLIRYDQGDRVVFQYTQDADGNTSRRLMKVIGREDDLMVMPDGSKRRPDVFDTVLENYSNIFQYRIVQRNRYFFEILIAADQTYLMAIRNELLQTLKEKFPFAAKFEIKHVDQIRPDQGGKLRMFKSEVRSG